MLKIFLPLCCFLMVSVAEAQDFINEDFLEDLEKNTQTLWMDKTPAFDISTTPDKYKNESATIIGYKRSVLIDKKSRIGFLSRGERSLIFFENVHFKILLNDKNAVQSFTTLYFRYSDKEDGFSAKLIKPGGISTEVKLNEAVGIEASDDMPEFFKSFFDQEYGNQQRYYKVAVPGLEPGDILEYVTVSKSKLNVAGSGYIEFTPQYELCNKKYPTLFNQVIIDTDDKSFFKSMSLNGAPDFKKEPAAEPGFFRYVFTDYDRPVEKDINFVNTYKVSPMTKFQVIYANNENAKGALIGQKGEIKNGFTKEELAKKAWEEYKAAGKYAFNTGTVQQLADALWAILKKAGATDWPEKDFINKSYYLLRQVIVNRDTYIPDRVASFIYGSLLARRDIKYDVIISVSNSIGGLQDILFDQEIRYAIKLGDKILFNPTDYSNPGDLVENLLGSEAYIIYEPEKKVGTQEIKLYTLPDAGFNDNISSYNYEVALNPDLNTLAVSRTSLYKGLSKARNVVDALKFTPYMLDDYKYYGGEAPTENMREMQEEEYFKSVKALKDRFKEAKPVYVKSQLQHEFSQNVTYKNFSLTSDGRAPKMQDLNFKEDFELAGMVRKAGKKLLVNIPGLVGGQLRIKKEERMRNHPITAGAPRTFLWQISFKIPLGYTAEGLQELVQNIDSEAGSFTSAAEEKNGAVLLTVKKIYKKNNLPKEKWNDMLAFIDAAYNNSFKYILLKPKG